MLDVDQRRFQHHKLSLAPWLYKTLTESGESLRVRLRGNNLHILCEDILCPEATKILSRFKNALHEQGRNPVLLSQGTKDQIEKVFLYGRAGGQKHHAWVEPIVLNTLEDDISPDSTFLISNESLARSGSVTAIARLLSDSLSHLGVKVKVLLQKLTPKQTGNSLTSNTIDNKRLWVICQCNYSPDPSLLAEPIAQKLRDLRLEGFREAVIRSSVQGESNPDWVLRVDLTHPKIMLRDWAKWGDVQSLSRLLNRSLAAHHWEFGAILKDVTLHIFCRVLDGTEDAVPDQETAVQAIDDLLTDIAPQGIESATIYGVQGNNSRAILNRPDSEEYKPAWIDWLELPAAMAKRQQERSLEKNSPPSRSGEKPAPFYQSPLFLAGQGNQEALIFLLQRLLNPDLDERLGTGGIRIKLCQKQDLLHVMTEAIYCPVQDQVTSSIVQLLRQLSLPQITGVRIYGRRAGQSYPLWNYGVDFVRRNRLVPSASPDFAALEAAEVADLESEPSLVHQQPPLHGFRDALQQIFELGKYSIQHWLCRSRLFILEQSSEAIPLSYPETNPRFSPNTQGIKVVLLWSALGLLVTLQTDWFGGQLLRGKQSPEKPFPETSLTPETVELPDLSLQKSTPENGEDVFAGGKFTGEESTEIIVSGTVSEPAIAATLEALRTANPSFNNPILDNKLALYQQRVLQRGVPDVLIIGSSRAMRGIDPIALQNALSNQGYGNLEIFNFGVNGATAQVVDLILRRLLPPEQLPKLILWADGARAFNSGRQDSTYEAIASSVGYQTLEAGDFPNPISSTRDQPVSKSQKIPSLQGLDPWLNETLGNLSSTYPYREQLKSWLSGQIMQQSQRTATGNEDFTALPGNTPEDSEMDLDGFLPISIRFDPQTYYESHPRVVGAYDGDYQSFNLAGKQSELSLELLTFLQTHQVNLVFINLPLTQDYLDPVRREYEQQFQEHLHQIDLNHGLIFRNLNKDQRWSEQYELFSDPSHLNRYGAYQVAIQLAQDAVIPWSSAVNP